MSTTEALPVVTPTAEPADDLPKVARHIKGFVEHPVTRLVVGLILIVTSSVEAYDSFHNDLYRWRLRAHHGLLVLGFVNVLAAIPSLIEGLGHYLAFRAKARALLRLKQKAREGRS